MLPSTGNDIGHCLQIRGPATPEKRKLLEGSLRPLVAPLGTPLRSCAAAAGARITGSSVHLCRVYAGHERKKGAVQLVHAFYVRSLVRTILQHLYARATHVGMQLQARVFVRTGCASQMYTDVLYMLPVGPVAHVAFQLERSLFPCFAYS
jgi:hypothetical protein